MVSGSAAFRSEIDFAWPCRKRLHWAIIRDEACRFRSDVGGGSRPTQEVRCIEIAPSKRSFKAIGAPTLHLEGTVPSFTSGGRCISSATVSCPYKDEGVFRGVAFLQDLIPSCYFDRRRRLRVPRSIPLRRCLRDMQY